MSSACLKHSKICPVCCRIVPYMQQEICIKRVHLLDVTFTVTRTNKKETLKPHAFTLIQYMLLKILKPLLLSLLLSHTHFYLFKWLRYQFSFHNFFFLSLGFLMHIFMLVLLHIYYLYTYICMIHRNNIKNYVINNFIYHFFPFSLCNVLP